MICPAHIHESWDEEPTREPSQGDHLQQSWWVEDRPGRNYFTPETRRGERTSVRRSTVVKPAPRSILGLERSIEEARSTFALRAGETDDEGQTATRETLDRAIRFLYASAELIFKSGRGDIDVPDVLPGPDGSVDLLWRNGRYELLINIPAGEDTVADFYGDRADGLKIKGTFRPEIHHQGILAWLTDPR